MSREKEGACGDEYHSGRLSPVVCEALDEREACSDHHGRNPEGGSIAQFTRACVRRD